MTMSTTSMRIPADHPALAGHFPGEPLVPATVLLDAVREAIGANHPNYRLATLSHAKFLSPLRPEQDAKIEVDVRGRIVRFRCLRGTDTIIVGEIVVASED